MLRVSKGLPLQRVAAFRKGLQKYPLLTAGSLVRVRPGEPTLNPKLTRHKRAPPVVGAIIRHCSPPDASLDYELLARVWEAANTKARALGWIV
jgi:hypothetical protein